MGFLILILNHHTGVSTMHEKDASTYAFEILVLDGKISLQNSHEDHRAMAGNCSLIYF